MFLLFCKQIRSSLNDLTTSLLTNNEIFAEIGIALPVQGQAITTTENRLEKGIQAQVDIFGEHMRAFYQSGDPEG